MGTGELLQDLHGNQLTDKPKVGPHHLFEGLTWQPTNKQMHVKSRALALQQDLHGITKAQSKTSALAAFPQGNQLKGTR
jgi:hypothetical protein